MYQKDGVGSPVKILVTKKPCAINHHTIKHLSKNKMIDEPILERIRLSDHS